MLNTKSVRPSVRHVFNPFFCASVRPSVTFSTLFSVRPSIRPSRSLPFFLCVCPSVRHVFDPHKKKACVACYTSSTFIFLNYQLVRLQLYDSWISMLKKNQQREQCYDRKNKVKAVFALSFSGCLQI